ncbi:hypothetical protein ACHQM5_003557 [Ranunculus cassubicifolius]
MGNCCRCQASTEWGGDEWGSPLPPKLAMKNGSCSFKKSPETESLLEDDERNDHSSSTEVKIKITKKELEELLGRGNIVQGMSVEQVLAQLIKVRDDEGIHAHHHSHWKPALQSIPEVIDV